MLANTASTPEITGLVGTRTFFLLCCESFSCHITLFSFKHTLYRKSHFYTSLSPTVSISLWLKFRPQSSSKTERDTMFFLFVALALALSISLSLAVSLSLAFAPPTPPFPCHVPSFSHTHSLFFCSKGTRASYLCLSLFRSVRDIQAVQQANKKQILISPALHMSLSSF